MITRPRQKINGCLEPDWQAEENRYPIRCIITNLFATSLNGINSCPFCGSEFSTPPLSREEAAMSTRHGRGCVWVEALRLFGVEVNQK